MRLLLERLLVKVCHLGLLSPSLISQRLSGHGWLCLFHLLRLSCWGEPPGKEAMMLASDNSAFRIKHTFFQLLRLSLVAMIYPNMLSGRQNKPLAPPQLNLVDGGVMSKWRLPFVPSLGRILIVSGIMWFSEGIRRRWSGLGGGEGQKLRADLTCE